MSQLVHGDTGFMDLSAASVLIRLYLLHWYGCTWITSRTCNKSNIQRY